MKAIPYARQNISGEDVQAVIDVLQSDWLTQGPTIETFENRMATYCGANHAVAVNSATSALHIACLAAGLGPGDRLWTTPNSFVASANCALYCGAEVDFVDINPQTLNLDPSLLEAKLESAAAAGRLPKAVIPVHFAGEPCDMAEIAACCRRYGVAIIEDASHAVGAIYQGRKIGSSQYSDMTVFSFHPVKIIATGEGGMVLTNNHDTYEQLQLLRSHGVTRNPAMMTGPAEGGWYYQQIELGYNYRLTELQAALGLSQLQRIEAFLAKRRELAARYNEMLRQLPLILPHTSPDRTSAHHLYPVQVRPEGRRARAEVYDLLHNQNIKVNVHYIPIHLQPYYRQLGFKPGDFPNAEAYYRGALSLPMFYDLSFDDQDKVVAALEGAFS